MPLLPRASRASTFIAPLASIALAVTVLTGQVTDKTTGQPLPGVQVLLTAHGKKAGSGYTNADGHYRIRKLTAGTYDVTLSSDDVPTQAFHVRIGTKPAQTANVVACSITLDYSCGSL
jgi:protocatechuate 3,4-dioxygenase beta subunit